MKNLLALLLCLLISYSAQAAEETFTLIDGEMIKVLYFQPDGFNNETPLAVLLAGGSNNEFMARTQFWMGKEMVSRGWAIAIPISPEGRKYFIENAALFPDIISHVRETHRIQPAKTLLVGISSGGSAALAIAARNPDHYMGVIAAPGRIHNDVDLGALHGLPVYLRIGEKDDFRWNKEITDMIEHLERAGALVDAAVVPGARHTFPLNWEELESWLESVKSFQSVSQ